MSGARCLWRRWCSGRRRVRPPAWCALLGRAAWCARGRRPAREPSALRASLGASSRSPARPRRPRAVRAGSHRRRSLLFVAPLVFWAPSGPAARESATREPAARRGRSRSPPWPSGPSGALRTGGACVAVCGGASPRSPARLCRRPWVPQPGPPTPWPCCFVACGAAGVLGAFGSGRVAGLLGVPVGGRPAREPSAPRASLGASPRSPARPRPPPTGTAAWPSGPSDALHTGGACGAVCGGASPRSPARPCRRPWVLQVGYPDPPAPSMPAVLPGFAIDRIARGYCTG